MGWKGQCGSWKIELDLFGEKYVPRGALNAASAAGPEIECLTVFEYIMIYFGWITLKSLSAEKCCLL